LTAVLFVCIFSLAMKKLVLKINESPPTGVTLLSGAKLKPYLELWEKTDSLHGLYKAMDRVPGGNAVSGTRLKKLAKDGLTAIISDGSKFALVTVLREVHPKIVWDDIAESWD
jgi:hypothetical protein